MRTAVILIFVFGLGFYAFHSMAQNPRGSHSYPLIKKWGMHKPEKINVGGGDVVDSVRGEVFRFYDDSFEVLCYVTYHGGIDCLPYSELGDK